MTSNNAREQLEMHLQKRQKIFGIITLQIPFENLSEIHHFIYKRTS
ncbi:hypothetical protein ABIA69_001791 [Lysinibacillus parviboronicapiens]|uniref:Uncharacterized protein n=1 Tax=Lysinibacillus parviboronicapiens TaxID=436516 RepID=A0ABV2PI73_9BACI|nr:hypothetical protein [Lysinibacillus parviboronicapiens]